MRDGKKKGARFSGRVFVAVITGISATILITSLVGNREVFSKLKSSHPLWIFITFLIALLVILLDSLRISLLSGSVGKKLDLWKSMKASIYGFYISAITPFSSGGQPFQIYYLSKLGLKVEEASMIVSVKFITSFTITVIWGMLALLKCKEDISSVPYVGKLMIFGVSLTIAFYVFFLLLAVGGRFGKWFLKSPLIVVPIAFFLKKDREEVFDVVESRVEEYRKVLASLWRKSKWHFFANSILSFFMITSIFSSPYFSMKAVGADIDFFRSLSLTAAMSMIFYFVPTPGASGGVEGVFYLVYSYLVTPTLAASGLIIWRFFTYHMSIILGAALSAGYVVRGDRNGGSQRNRLEDR